jgi:hypothetical protein
MAITATNNSVERELVPEGTHVAICYSMIDLGTKEETFNDPKKGDIVKVMHKARLEWELCNESFTYEKDNETITGLMRIGKDYTLSMNEKSNLRKDLTSWRGQAFTEEQAKSFDITVLLGKPCLITIIHAVSQKGTKYAKISGISNLVKGMVAPVPVNKNFLFELDSYSDTQFALIPEWIQNQIKESDEYKAINPIETPPQSTPSQIDQPQDNEEVDDLPF